MNSLIFFYKKFQKFNGNLSRLEKIFFYTFILDLFTYSSLFISFLISTGEFKNNFLFITLLFFPTISGIVTFHNKSIIHGIVFLAVHSFPLIAGIFYFYTQSNVCRDKVDACVLEGSADITAALLLSFIILFQLLHMICLHLLWIKGTWPFVHEFKLTKNEEIKKMYLVYEFQLTIFHAKYMIVGLWIVFYTIMLWSSERETIDYYIKLSLNLLFFIYSTFMIKGVREEKSYMLYIVYFGNLFQSLLLIYNTNNYCFQYMSNPSLHRCLKYDFFYVTIFFLGCLGFTILGLSTWNTIKCHRNFGRNLGSLYNGLH